MEVCHCNNEAEYRCSRCRKAYYCSEECQSIDWELGHKTSCKLIEGRQEIGFMKSEWFKAAQNQQTGKMLKMLKYDDADIDVQDEDGWSALMIASGFSNSKWVKKLVNLGANVNSQNDEGDTALLIAALWGYFKTIKILIDAGADVDTRNNEDDSALMVATKQSDNTSNLETVQVLLEADDDVFDAYYLCPDDICRTVFRIVQYRRFLNPGTNQFSQTTKILKKLKNRAGGSKLFAKRFIKSLNEELKVSSDLSQREMLMLRFENQNWNWPTFDF